MTKRAKPAITAEQRAALIKQLRAGYSLPVAASKAGVDLATVRRAGARLDVEIAEAERYAESHLDGLLLERGLAGDSGCLRLAVERRDRAASPALAPNLDSNDAIEVARRLAFLLAAGDHQLSKLAPATATPRPPAPVAAPPAPVAAPTMPPGYSYEPTTARVLCPDGELAGHGLSMDRAIEVAVSDLARRTRVPPEDRTPFHPGATANKERFS